MIVFNKSDVYNDSVFTLSSPSTEDTTEKSTHCVNKLQKNKKFKYKRVKKQQQTYTLSRTNQKFLQSLGFQLK